MKSLARRTHFFLSSQGQEVEIKKQSTGPWFFVFPKRINKLEAFLHGQVLVQVYGTWLQKLALHVEANILGHTMMMSKMKAPMLKVVDSTLAHPDFLRSKTNNQIQWPKPESDPLLGFSSYDILLNLMDQNSKGFDFMQVLIVSKGFKGFAFSEQTEESLSRFFGQTKGQVSHRWGTMSIVSKLIAATEDGVIDDRERQDLQVLLHHVFFCFSSQCCKNFTCHDLHILCNQPWDPWNSTKIPVILVICGVKIFRTKWATCPDWWKHCNNRPGVYLQPDFSFVLGRPKLLKVEMDICQTNFII